MESIKLRTLRRLRQFQLYGLLLASFSAITAMDDTNMFGMYDSADADYSSDDSLNSSYSDSDGETTANNSFESYDDSSMDADNMGSMYDAADNSDSSDSSFSSSSMYSSPSSVKHNFDKKHFGILHKTVDNSQEENNGILLDFYDEDYNQISDEEVCKLDKKNQRLKFRLEYIIDVIEGRSKNGKSELFQLLPQDQDVAKYDVGIDGAVNPNTGKIEFNSHINVVLKSKSSDANDKKILANVDKIKKDLKRYYNVKNVGYDVEKELE